MTEDRAHLLTTSQIAAIAGVDASTVSNWRRRFVGSFPEPVSDEMGDRRPRFDHVEILQWLRENPQVGGKSTEREDGLTRTLKALQGEFSRDRAVDLIGELLVLIEQDRRAGSLQQSMPAHEIRARLRGRGLDLDSASLTSQPSLFSEDVLEAAYAVLLSARDPLSSFDEALFRTQNRLSEDSELTTSSAVSQFLVSLADDNSEGIVYDPAAGYGTLLLDCIMGKKARRGVGIDVNSRATHIANQRIFLSEADARVSTGDSLLDVPPIVIQADLVVADPPLGMMFRGGEGEISRRAWEFGPPKATSADTAWLQHSVSRLKTGGRAIVVTTVNTLFSGDKATAHVRSEMLRRGAVQAVFTLPAKLRMNTNVRLAVWILTTPDAPHRRSEVLLIDLGADDRKSIDPRGEEVKTFHSWMAESDVHLDPTFAVAVPVTELLAPDATLVPSRWLSTPEESLDSNDWKRLAESNYEAATSATTQRPSLPQLSFETVESKPTKVSIGELTKRGALQIMRGRHFDRASSPTDQTYPIMTVREARSVSPDAELATERTEIEPATTAQLVLPGDVLVYQDRDTITARVWLNEGWVLGRFMQAIRIGSQDWDAHYLAAAISHPINVRHQLDGSGRTHFKLNDFEIVIQPREAQLAAKVVATQFDATAAELQTAAKQVADARAEVLNAITSGLVKVNAR